MKKLTTIVRMIVIIGGVFTLASLAQAQNRVFVSGLGDDINPCTRTMPCRNFQRGHDAVATGGEVVALDDAGYGTLIINKAVTINGGGHQAGVTVIAGDGITVNPAGANDIVNIIGVSVYGAGGTNGFRVFNGRVNIRNCSSIKFTRGLYVTTGEVNVDNTEFSHNTTAVRADGQGPDLDYFVAPSPARVSLVRIARGIIADNETAFDMRNPGSNNTNTAPPTPGGTRQAGGSNNATNIFIVGGGSPLATNILGNNTFVIVFGLAETNPWQDCTLGCINNVIVGSYTPQGGNCPVGMCNDPAVKR